jgi:glycosyltransferase involved in cell wall biosynthesis
MTENFKQGISIVICCHNSAEKLPETLRHIQNQAFIREISWEVLIIDNASTDKTSKVAESIWDLSPVTTLRVVNESRLGLVFARIRGFREACHDVVSFVDDDNWLDENWVYLLNEVMRREPAIGACGGLNTAVFECDKPGWFDEFEKSYAVGEQAARPGDITENPGILCGAGLSIRKSAWDQLNENGFSFTLVGRQGNELLCGEDYELCLAIRLAGWKIWYEPALKLQHYLPTDRLDWKHLRRMIRGYGFTKSRLAAYGYGDGRLHENGACSWWRVCWRICKSFIRRPVKSLMAPFLAFEGDRDITNLDIKFGEFKEILMLRSSYVGYFEKVKNAAWNRTVTNLK